MPKCKFRFTDHSTCNQPCEVKTVDKSITYVDKVHDANGNLKTLRCFHPVLEYSDYCHSHRKMMIGRLLPVELTFISKSTLKTIAARREIWQETFQKKKRLTHVECG